MKHWFLAALLLPVCAFAQTVNPLFTEGVAAFKKGDYAGARHLFETVLAQDPKDPAAQNYLKMIAAREKTGAGVSIEVGLRKIIIPKVEFTDSNIRDAMTYVSQQVKSISKGAQSLNVVWLVPEDYSKKVTLSLTNIPASEVMKYLAEAGNLTLEYDAYAVKVKPTP